MKIVWKFPLGMGPNKIDMPIGAKVVDVAMQGGFPHLWVEVQDPEKVERRLFEVFGTGHPIPDEYDHVGTFHDPPFVWHVYENSPHISESD